jgi:hypothetical protein
MFTPYRFYNCANQDPKLNAARSFLIDAKRRNPDLKLTIIILHPWHFRADVSGASIQPYSLSSRPTLPFNQYIPRLERKNLYDMVSTLDTTRTIGIRAIPQTRDMRLSDGSVTFGRHHHRTDEQHDKREARLMSQASYHMKKKSYFRDYDQPVGPSTIDFIDTVTTDLVAHGITPIYLIPPIHDEFIAIMDSDSSTYQLWHELKTGEVQGRLNEIAPTYDYSEFSSFYGTTDMTYDSWHCTELAAHLMTERLKSDPRSPELLRSLSAIPIDSIKSRYPTPVYSLYD